MASAQEVAQTTPEAPRKTAWQALIYVVAVALVCFGLFLRFDNLGKHTFWYDEALTMLHVSGYTYGEARDKIQDKVVTFGELQESFQTPKAGFGVPGTLRCLKYDQPQHAPLFYVLSNMWASASGVDPAAMRQLPAIISVLEIPLTFWLAFELFGSPVGAALAAGLMAVSPYQLWYAQDLREYSLLAVVICFSCASFLRAMRTRGVFDWVIYSLSVVLCVVSSVLTVFVLLSQLVFLVLSKPKFSLDADNVSLARNLFFYSLGVAVALGVTAPAIAQYMSNSGHTFDVVDWISQPLPFNQLIEAWLFRPLSIFYDQSATNDLSNTLLAFLLILFLYSAFLVFKMGERRALLFLSLIYGITALGFWLPDLILGGHRSIVVKHWMGIPIVVLLTVAYAVQLQLSSVKPGLRVLAGLMVVLVAGCEISSCFNVKAVQERHLVEGHSVVFTAKALEKDKSLLVVTGESNEKGNFTSLLALSHSIPPDIRLIWLSKPNLEPVPEESRQKFFTYDIDDDTVKMLKENGYRFKKVDKVLDRLFLVEKQ